MRASTILLKAFCIAALSVSAAAETLSAAPAAVNAAVNAADGVPMRDDSVFKAFHGKAGIDRVVTELYRLVQEDPRTTDIFKASDIDKVKRLLGAQICYLLDGPCTYDGRDMKTAHKDLGLQDADFNALVEDLQRAMDKEGVPFRAQNKLLAKLAPMRRDVVER
jgi:hemoglobin